jgi:transcriptional regulator with XRE-family HTH domain
MKGGRMKTSTKKLLGQRIKELRKARGLSQDRLSEKIGIDSKHLSRIEVGKNYPSLDTLQKLADALHVELKDLFDFKHQVKQDDMRRTLCKLLNKTDDNLVRVLLKFVKEFV